MMKPEVLHQSERLIQTVYKHRYLKKKTTYNNNKQTTIDLKGVQNSYASYFKNKLETVYLI